MNFAIVGTNFISDNFSVAAKEISDGNVIAVYSRASETGNAFAKKHNIERVYTDYTKMLDDENIDAVYIASPTMCHAEQAILALRKKKHVLCEKMICAEYKEFPDMKLESERSGVVLIEAMRPDFDEILMSVANNIKEIGKIKSAKFEYCQYSSRYDKFKAGEILNAFDPKIKNSALADIGIYPLHYAISLFGSPKKITSEGEFLHNGFLGKGRSVLSYDGFDAETIYSKIHEGENVSKITGELGEITFDKINEPTYFKLKLYGKDEKIFYANPNKSNMKDEIYAFKDICERDQTRAKALLEVTEKTMIAVDNIYSDLGVIF